MAVKEEKYDPGYEAAYGGSYAENLCNSEPCSFSSNGLSMFPSYVCFKDLVLSGLGKKVFSSEEIIKEWEW